MGAVDEALAAHRREVEVLDHRAHDNPGVAGFDAELVGGYARLLESLRSAGRPNEAAKVADRARERIAETTEETTEYFERSRLSRWSCIRSPSTEPGRRKVR